MSEALTFTVVENYEPPVDYEEFKKDFLDPSTRVPQLKEKYKLSKTRWKYYRDRVLEDEGINRKPVSDYHNSIVASFPCELTHIPEGQEFIQKSTRGWKIVKTIRYVTTHYGRYPTLECAMKIRDKLVEAKWDKDVGEYYKKKYGLDRWKPAKIKALKKYNLFEHLYIYSDKRIEDILKEMGLTQKMYTYLLKEVRKNHGDLSRRDLRAKYGVSSKVMKPNYDCEM